MDIVKEIKKQANNIMKDKKKKEKIGDTIEYGLEKIKNQIKDQNKKDLIDKAIKAVDDATTTKKKTNSKSTKKNTSKKTTNKKNSQSTSKKTTNKKNS